MLKSHSSTQLTTLPNQLSEVQSLIQLTLKLSQLIKLKFRTQWNLTEKQLMEERCLSQLTLRFYEEQSSFSLRKPIETYVFITKTTHLLFWHRILRQTWEQLVSQTTTSINPSTSKSELSTELNTKLERVDTKNVQSIKKTSRILLWGLKSGNYHKVDHKNLDIISLTSIKKLSNRS